MARRIALYGGSFDPIHFGHLISARAIAEQLQVDRVVLIPSARPPHKGQAVLAAPAQRIEMVRLAVEGDDLFEVSDIEFRRDGPSYTILTVMEYRRSLEPGADLYWIIGADSLNELRTWYRVVELLDVVQIVTAARPGWTPPELSRLAEWAGGAHARLLLQHCCPTPGIEISSTNIRERIREGKPVRYLLPERVEAYIRAQSLYRD